MSRSERPDDDFFLPAFGAPPPPPAMPPDEPDRWAYITALWNALVWDHKASRLAAALTYHTIFSLVPVAIVCMVVVRGVVKVEEAHDWMRRVVYDSGPWKNMFAKYPHAQFSEGLDYIISTTWNLNLADVGIAGGLLLIWAALGLFKELEQSFNEVMGVACRRPLFRRLTMYWAFVTLGPLLLFGSLYGAAKTVAWMHAHPALPFLADFLAAWLMLLVIYKALPNTTVRWYAAAIGSGLASVLWVIAKWGFEMYVMMAMPYSELYGSLALVPLFLFWLYMIWWIVLMGLEVTAFRQRRLDEAEAESAMPTHWSN